MNGNFNVLLSSSSKNLTDKLVQIHQSIMESMPGIARIACALYDPESDLLKTFINSTKSGHAIEGYEYPLSKSRSLVELKSTLACRVIDNIPLSIQEGTEHSDWLLEQGYISSLTVPLTHGDQLLGLVFIDSCEEAYFTEAIQRNLILFCNIISMSISFEISAVKSLLATAKAAREFTSLRDFETGMHLSRMAHFTRLIGKAIKSTYQLSDEFIEHVFLFAPLHDIGKIGIPDHILLKQAKLTPDEYDVIKTHVTKGANIIKKVLEDYQLNYLDDSKIMFNIVAYHHELMDGSGYPNGLKGDNIPIEARMTTAADIFDALTSERPYKRPWSIEAALQEMVKLASVGKVDPACVQALVDNQQQLEAIMTDFADLVD